MADGRRTRAVARLCGGPLAGVIDDVVRDMEARGHAAREIDEYVGALHHVSRWLQQHERDITTFGESELQACVQQAGGRRADRIAWAGRRLLATLHARGLGRASAPRIQSAAQQWTTRFLDAARRTRGLAAGTCRVYAGHVHALLASLPAAAMSCAPWPAITVEDVREFVVGLATTRGTGVAKAGAKAARAFLRYLVQEGGCASALVDAVPTVRHPPVPLGPRLTAEHIRTLLASFDRTSATGRRDYAIALCVARLGLRACDVVGIRLDDIAWRAGTMQICGSKSRRTTPLPLPADVGRALADYLQHGRPSTPTRSLFVRHLPPVGEPLTSGAARAAIRQACRRAEGPVPSHGTHSLRRAVASALVGRGVSLKAVADVLGHRSLDTTVLYARVDLGALRAVALPWPEVV